MIKLVVVGHLAVNETETSFGKGVYWAGAGYQVAWAAAQFFPKKGVKLISLCGQDFDLSGLFRAGIDLEGVVIDQRFNSDRFIIKEKKEERFFKARGDLSSHLSLDHFNFNQEINWCHLATAPPR